MNAVRSPSSRQAVNVSSNWSTASTKRPRRRSHRRRRAARAADARRGGCTCCGHDWLPGSTPLASAGSRPARTTDDLPLPDGPTTPSSGAPTSRATSSATSRSRPKKYGASSASNDARPLKGHTTGASPSCGSAGSRVAWSWTTPPASSASIERRSARPAAAREATSCTRRPASRRAHRLAASWTRRGMPALSSSSRWAGTSSAASGGAYWGDDRADRRLVERVEHQHDARVAGLGDVGDGDDEGVTAELARRRRDLLARTLGVVEHDEQRAGSIAGLRENLFRPRGRRVEHRRAAAVHLRGELGNQPALPDPLLAGKRDEPASARRAPRPSTPEATPARASRPTSGGAAATSSWSGRSTPVATSRSDSSCRSIASWSARSSGPGSMPRSSASFSRALR